MQKLRIWSCCTERPLISLFERCAEDRENVLRSAVKDNPKRHGRGSAPRALAAAAGALLALALGAPVCEAQLPSPNAAALGLGDRTAAGVRGFAAVAANPAGLGMPRPTRFTLAPLPFRLGGGMGPVTLADLAEHDGRDVPDAVREAWLQRIEARGEQTGRGEAGLTLAAGSVDRVGFQLSTLAVATAELNPDAAELLLFGNAGRTGEPRELHLGGSSFDAWVVTTLAVGVGIPLDVEIGDADGQAFAIGATLKLMDGNALWLGRDLGSFVAGEPFEVWLRFPVIQTRPGDLETGAARGVGLDVGFQWEMPGWRAGLAATNVVNTFRWKLDELVFRPGTALFTQDASEADFTPRPAAEAPLPLRQAVQAFRFARRVAGALERRTGARTTLHAQLDARIGGGADGRAPFEAGLGVEHRPTPRLPLRAHASALSDGYRLGGGAGVVVGPARLDGAASYVSRASSDAWTAAVGVVLGWN